MLVLQESLSWVLVVRRNVVMLSWAGTQKVINQPVETLVALLLDGPAILFVQAVDETRHQTLTGAQRTALPAW